MAKLAEAAGTLALVDARERGVHVSFRFGPRLPPVRVDRVQIHQVLFNLMRNALEAMAQSDQGTGTVRPPRGRHELIVTAAADEPGMVDVAIADTGPGLTPEMADHLFSPFVSTKPDGVGLGLSICRSIIEAHGGRLWVEPNQGRGAVFRFTLPAESSGEDG
ncbi:MAG: sensor histidine kinase [Geminicoccaceae bacterium]